MESSHVKLSISDGYISWTWHKEKKLFIHSGLFDCIFLFGTRSKERSVFLFWCSITWFSKPLHYTGSVLHMCSVIYQISHLSRVRRALSWLLAAVLATVELPMHITVWWCACHPSERLDGKYCGVIQMCDLVLWCSATLFPYSHINTFFFPSLLGVWPLLAVPLGRMLYIYNAALPC